MVSAIDLSKRALVTLLNSLANVYAVVLGITRESPDGDVHRAYRKLSKKCHPDKGGKRGHQQSLNAAFDTWEGAKRSQGQGHAEGQGHCTTSTRTWSRGCRDRGDARSKLYERVSFSGCGLSANLPVVWRTRCVATLSLFCAGAAVSLESTFLVRNT